MNKLREKLNGAENRFNELKTINRAVVFILRCWQLYVFSGDDAYLHKAYHACVIARGVFPASARIFFCAVFCEMQLKNFARAEHMLLEFNNYKNYYKQNEPHIFLIYNFFAAGADIAAGRTRQASRKIKLIREAPEFVPDALRFLILGAIETERGAFEKGYEYITDSFHKGGNSVFMYVYMYRLFVTQSHADDTRRLFGAFLNWSYNIDAGLDLVADHYRDSVLYTLKGLRAAERLYKKYPFNWLLENICKELADRRDFSPNACHYFKLAQDTQLNFDDLDIYLLTALYLNKKEGVRRHLLEKYLARTKKDFLLLAFSYHMIINDANLSGLADKETISQFAADALKKRGKGRYFNSLYAYLIKERDAFAPDDETVKSAAAAIENCLFDYEADVADPAVGYVWIYEDVKRDRGVFKVADGKVRIKAATEKFTYILTDLEQKEILPPGGERALIFSKLVANTDEGLYLYFLNAPLKDADLYIGLSALYIEDVSPPERSIDILKTTLAMKNIAQPFRNTLAAALGNMLANKDRYDMAMEFYELVDINYLNENFIEQMLSAFIRAGCLKEAVDLIVKKPHCIPDRSLFNALKAVAPNEAYHADIADAAYELLLKSWYDLNLIDVVLNNYNGSQNEWQELARSLSGIRVYDAALDERIVVNSIWMHMPDPFSQKVFLRMADSSPSCAAVNEYTYFLIYEMLALGFKPDYETVEYLENILQNDNDKYLAYALFHYYAEHSVQTFHSDEIIIKALDYMEADGILLPSAVKLKDKSGARPYIFKYQPFVYRAAPGREVYLYYKFDPDTEFMRKKMKYTRYGMYMQILPVFYCETAVYHFSEEMGSGSISTQDCEVTNLSYILPEKSADGFFHLNNAFIYEQMFKYDNVEKIIMDNVLTTRMVKGKNI